jgi:hypothetical protein
MSGDIKRVAERLEESEGPRSADEMAECATGA